MNLNYRSKLALTENVRIVEIPGVDLCACCAPHVDTTGQIGLIKIVNVQSHRGGVRINILCGGRALADYTEKQDSVWAISSLLSAKQPEVADAVVRAKEDARQQKERANALQAELLKVQMNALPSPEETCHVLLFVGELDAIALRNAVNSLTENIPATAASLPETMQTATALSWAVPPVTVRSWRPVCGRNFRPKAADPLP